MSAPERLSEERLAEIAERFAGRWGFYGRMFTEILAEARRARAAEETLERRYDRAVRLAAYHMGVEPEDVRRQLEREG